MVHDLKNKAGYTANTSRGRVGRGGNARFHTFQLDHHGPTNRPTNGRTDRASYRVAYPRLKNGFTDHRQTDRLSPNVKTLRVIGLRQKM